MKKLSLVLLCGIMIVGTAFAGGSIFGGHHKKTRNADGVSSVGIKICGSLLCPDVIIKEGSCGDIQHATQQYGVCVCDDGYKVKNGECVLATQANCTEPGEKWCSALNNCIDSTDCCKYLSVSDCQTCDSETGTVTDKESGLCSIGGTKNAGYCFSGECLNPCEENSIDNCKTCTPVSGEAVCSECDEGYHLSGNTCVANTCASTNTSITGCTAYDTCVTPNSTYYTCTECGDGYTLTNKACIANTCTTTNTDKTGCSNYTPCTTPAGTYYTCTECSSGYTLDEINHKCTANTCTSTNTSTIGCSNYTPCTKPTGTYYTCTTCETGYSLQGYACVENTCTSTNTDKTGCNIYDTCETSNNTYYSCTGCKNGYTLSGDTCVENTCTSTNTEKTGCSTYDTCETPDNIYYTCTECNSGYTLTGKACVENTCTSTNTDKTGCTAYDTCITPMDTYYTCTNCDGGYNLQGNACVENSCTTTNTDKTGCSSYTPCITPTGTYYTCTGCNEGYTLNGDKCEVNTCGEWTITSHIEGCASENSCSTPNNTYYKCTVCDTGYELSGETCTSCESGTVCAVCGLQDKYWNGSACVECTQDGHCGTGYTCTSNACEANICTTTNTDKTGCSSYTSCTDPSNTYYTCTGCNDGYTLDNTNHKCEANHCDSTNTDKTGCSTYNTCTTPDNTYYTCTECAKGHTLQGNACVLNTCTDWTITSPITGCTNAGKSTCETPENTYYKCSECDAALGYDLENNTCIAHECPDWSNTTSPIVGCASGEESTCVTPNNTYYKCTTCDTGYELDGEICTPCIEGTECSTCGNTNKYWNGSACVECTQDGQCGSGYTCTSNTCVANTCSDWNNTTSPILGCVSGNEATCVTPNNTYHRCTICDTGYQLDGEVCTPCVNGTECATCAPETKYWNGSSCVACLANYNSGLTGECTDISTPVCNDNNQCEACPTDEPVYEGGVCKCPTNASCENSSWACNDGYYKTGNTCTPCSGEHVATCNDSGLPTSCSDGYDVENNECKCTSGKFVAMDGICHSCSDDTNYTVLAKENCTACNASLRRFIPVTNQCVTNTCAANEFYDENGTCYSCETDGMPETSERACAICKSPNLRHWVTLKEGETTKRVCAKPCGSGQFRDWEGTCFACSEPTFPNTDEVENNECQTTSSKRIYVDGLSLLCTHNARLYSTEAQCKDSCGSLREWHGSDGCWLACGENEFHDVNGTCQSCSSDGIIPASGESEVCSNNGQKRFLGTDGLSYLCDTMEEPVATETECNKCGTIDNTTTEKRRIIGYEGKCIYNCGSNQFLGDNNTVCRSCDYGRTRSTQAQSHQCTNRFWSPYMTLSCGTTSCTTGAASIPCAENQENYKPMENNPTYAEYECGLCKQNNKTERRLLTIGSNTTCVKKCTDDEFYNSNGTCVSCADAPANTTPYSEEECLSCKDSNNNPIRGMFGTYCSKIGCGTDSGQFQKNDGGCANCNSSGAIIPAGANNTEKTTESDKCNYTDSPNRRFMGKDGKSYPCNKADGISAEPSENAKCGSRFMASDNLSYPCDYAAALTVANEAACNSICTSRQYSESDQKCYQSICSGFRSTDGTCYPCSESSNITTTDTESDNCKGTQNPRFFAYSHTGSINYTNKSLLCTSTATNAMATSTQCSNCDKRVLIDDYCVKKECAANKFLDKSSRACQDCNNKTAFEVVDSTYCEGQCNTTGQTADKLRETVEINGKNICQRKTCATGYIHQESTGTCIDCAQTSGLTLTDTELAECSAIGYSRFKGKDGKTYKCNRDSPVEVTTDSNCTQFCGTANEVVDIEQADNSVKKYCNKKCDGFFDRSGNCKTCGDSSAIDTTTQMCNRCTGTRSMVDGKCAPSCGTGLFRQSNGSCANCTTAAYNTQPYSDEECLSCKDNNNNSIRGIFNSKEDGTGTKYCSKLGCTQGNFQTYAGNCAGCNNATTTPAGNNITAKTTESDKCNYSTSSNRRFMGDNGKSYLCSINEAVSTSQTECNKCDGTNNTTVRSYNTDNGTCELPCTNGTQFRDNSGVCRDCSTTTTYEATKTENDKCVAPNKRLFTTDGKSYKCTDASKDLISDYCGNCVDSSNNALRVLVGDYCVLPCTKTDGNTIGGFHDNSNRACVSCDIKDAKEVFQTAECIRCNAGSNPNLRHTYQQGDKLYCALTACGTGYFRSQETGACLTCNASDIVHVTSDEETNCLTCGRVLMDNKLCVKTCSSNQFHNKSGICTGCNAGATETFVSELSNCTGTTAYVRFIDDSGVSYPCNNTTDPAPASTTSDSMATCTAAACGRTLFNGMCAPTCSANQFHTLTGKCTNCNDSTAAGIKTFASELNYCTGTTSTAVRFIDDNGTSYRCDSATNPIMVQEESRNSCTATACNRVLMANDRCAKTCNSNYFHTDEGVCTGCTVSAATKTIVSELSHCTGASQRFIDDDGMSYRCTHASSVAMTNQASINSCNACDSRVYNTNTGTCDKT